MFIEKKFTLDDMNKQLDSQLFESKKKGKFFSLRPSSTFDMRFRSAVSPARFHPTGFFVDTHCFVSDA
jgi:hypothetical protein